MRVLSRLFRRLFLERMEKAFNSGKLQFFASLESLRDPRTFAARIAAAKEYEWVVYAKRPFAGPQQVLDYVGRYTHRVAISNNRLVEIDNDRVQFHWKDYRDNSKIKIMDLKADEFIRRFLLHFLSEGFHRIRYYGFLANRDRRKKLELCRQLLGMQGSSQTTSVKDYRERYQELTGRWLIICPLCQQGRMVVVENLPPAGCRIPFPVVSS